MRRLGGCNMIRHSIQFVIVGVLMFYTPSMMFRNGPTDDAFTNMLQKLPLPKVLAMRNVVITGIMFVLFGLVSCAVGH
jgi:type IV secretory pathway VirB2 component (pilin)